MALFKSDPREPQWRLEHNFLYATLYLREKVGASSGDADTKALLMAAYDMAGGIVGRFTALSARAGESGPSQAFLSQFGDENAFGLAVDAATTNGGLLFGLAASTGTYGDITRLEADATSILGSSPFGQTGPTADPESCSEMAWKATNAIAGVEQATAQPSFWHEAVVHVFDGLGSDVEYHKDLRELSSEPFKLNEVAPTWGEYKRGRKSGRFPLAHDD